MAMKRMQVQLTHDMASWLAAEARRREMSISAVIRASVDASRRRDDGAWTRARQTFGCGRSGMGDLAVRHDEEWAAAIVDGQKPL